MATIYTGSAGCLYVDGSAVASVRSFSFEESIETVDATTMSCGAGVTWRTSKSTFSSWSGSCEIFWTTDEVAIKSEEGMPLVSGTEVEIVFYPSGNVAGEVSYTGNAIISSRSISSSVDGLVEASITITGTGPITVGNAV